MGLYLTARAAEIIKAIITTTAEAITLGLLSLDTSKKNNAHTPTIYPNDIIALTNPSGSTSVI